MKRTMAKMLQRAEQHDRGKAVVGNSAASPLAEKVADGRRSCVDLQPELAAQRPQAVWAGSVAQVATTWSLVRQSYG